MTLDSDSAGMQPFKAADSAYMAGHFSAAKTAFAAWAMEYPQDPRAALRMGQLSLLENRPADAIEWLNQAAALGMDSQALLAEAYYRADRFAEAAHVYRRLGRLAIADHLSEFSRDLPYTWAARTPVTQLEFLTREPLPLLRAQVNDQEEALFLLDTGAWDTVLDAGLAARIGLTGGPRDRVQCAGGRLANVHYTQLATLALGDWVLNHVPVQVMALDAALAGFFEPHGVDGILGLGVLHRFAMQWHMLEGYLRLASVRQPRAQEIACWVSPGRQLLAWGEINQQANLWFVDTGMMGFDCLLPASTAARANLVMAAEPVAGYGGGGQVELRTAAVDGLGLAGYRKRDARAVIGSFALERLYGFHIGGLMSFEFLKQSVLHIDFSRMRLSIECQEC